MGCDLCRKKGIPIKCPYCPGSFCTRCMHLEVHGCEGVTMKKELHKKELEKKMAFDAPRKIEKI